MCGITGILGNGDSTVLGPMSNNLSHRGPDGFGSFESDLMVGSICLAQSRLAIVDVNGSKQPIESEHNCILVQNGEIYNFQKIKSEIQNYPWKTSGDSETILALHRKYAYENKKTYEIPVGKKVGSLIKTKDAELLEGILSGLKVLQAGDEAKKGKKESSKYPHTRHSQSVRSHLIVLSQSASVASRL